MPRLSGFDYLLNARVGDTPRLARRLVGLPYLSERDFNLDLDQYEGERLATIAREARGGGPSPILVLGVMPRSGTNFVRDLLALSPEVYPDPQRLYEFPLLHAASDSVAFTRQFVSYFPRNAEVIGSFDVLARLAGAWMREMQAEAGEKRLLLKSPHVQFLSLAPYIFPDSNLVICIRDGRDVVDSSRRTFSDKGLFRKSFMQLTREWMLATEAACKLADWHRPTALIRFEDLVNDPTGSVEKLLAEIDLSMASFPFGEVDRLPVRGSSRSDRTKESRWQPQERTRDFQPVGRWCSWSKRHIRAFDRIAGGTLDRAGYQRGIST